LPELKPNSKLQNKRLRLIITAKKDLTITCVAETFLVGADPDPACYITGCVIFLGNIRYRYLEKNSNDGGAKKSCV